MLHPRARTMLLLSIPAVLIGVASSLLLIVVLKIAAVLQHLLWRSLPEAVGVDFTSPVWIILMLTLTGIIVGLVIRYSPGHAGPDPASEPLIGEAVPPSHLPGLVLALILGLAGGVSLGPEHPIMSVNIALAVTLGARFFPRVNSLDWTILAAAGTIGALFGTPVAAALIFSQTLRRFGIVSSHRFWPRQPVRSPPDCSSTRSFRYLLSITRKCASAISSAGRLLPSSLSPLAWSQYGACRTCTR